MAPIKAALSSALMQSSNLTGLGVDAPIECVLETHCGQICSCSRLLDS